MGVSSSPTSAALQSLHLTTDLLFHLLFFSQPGYSSESSLLFPSLPIKLFSFLYFSHLVSYRSFFSSIFICLHNIFLLYSLFQWRISKSHSIHQNLLLVPTSPMKCSSIIPTVNTLLVLYLIWFIYLVITLYPFVCDGKRTFKVKVINTIKVKPLARLKTFTRKAASVTGAKTMPLHVDKSHL